MRKAIFFELDFIGDVRKKHNIIFHKWAKRNGDVMALIELKEGKIQMVEPNRIQFDPPSKIEDIK